MKVVDGIKYLTIGEAAKIVGRGAQTIKSWYKWAEQNNKDIKELGLPEFRRDIDRRQTYFFKDTDVTLLLKFKDSIAYGQMSDFNVNRWGERGKVIEAKKQEQQHA